MAHNTPRDKIPPHAIATEHATASMEHVCFTADSVRLTRECSGPNTTICLQAQWWIKGEDRTCGQSSPSRSYAWVNTLLCSGELLTNKFVYEENDYGRPKPVATRLMLYFKAKMHQIRFWLRLCPRPRWGSSKHPPNALAVGLFKESYF